MAHDTTESTPNLGVDDTARTRLVVVLLLCVVIQGVLLLFVREDWVLERRHLPRVALGVWPLDRDALVLENVRVPAGRLSGAGWGLLREGPGGRGGEGCGLLLALFVFVLAGDLGSDVSSQSMGQNIISEAWMRESSLRYSRNRRRVPPGLPRGWQLRR